MEWRRKKANRFLSCVMDGSCKCFSGWEFVYTGLRMSWLGERVLGWVRGLVPSLRLFWNTQQGQLTLQVQAAQDGEIQGQQDAENSKWNL